MRISFGAYLFDTECRLLQRDGEPLPLSPKAFAVLELLIRERPRAVSKQALLDRVWPDVIVEEQNVKNAIVEIRARLGADHSVIRTVQRFGYAFAAEGADAPTARLLTEERSYALHSGENVIGRAGDADVLLNATGVSRHHARIILSDGSAVLEDLGSKNGTWRNDERIIEPVAIRDGDSLRIGVAALTFRLQSHEPTTTLA